MANLEKEKQERQEQIKNLSSSNDKLSKEKDSLVLNKNEALNQVRQEHLEQLRKINLLFDDKAKDYKTIDFNGLYSLLETIKQERERERESKK